jgi:hypothetical protein
MIFNFYATNLITIFMVSRSTMDPEGQFGNLTYYETMLIRYATGSTLRSG